MVTPSSRSLAQPAARKERAKQAAKDLCAVSGIPFFLILSPCVAGVCQDWLKTCIGLASQLDASWAKKMKHLFFGVSWL